MMYSKLAVLLGSIGLSSLPFAVAQSPSAPSSSPVQLPPGTTLSGDYSGPLRPQVHYSAPQGFINDPNGMFLDANGTYHLYYQYNPTQTISGNVHWGHATSTDLYTWTNQPIALAPDNATALIFSGSIVTDPNNTSGFFPNQTNGVVAYYTLAGPNQQTQDLAYSLDGGYTFIKYPGNPLIEIGSPQFRDPKVFWYAPSSHWVMILAFTQEFSIGIYTSPNMIDWTPTSNFSHHGLLGTQYECPNLVEMPVYHNFSQPTGTTMWLMYISIQPGAPLGGSIGQYFPGTFNGTHFEAVDAVARIADWGKDNYASQFFYGIDASERQVSIAWASNWQYCNYVPTGPSEGWASVMSVPRVNYLRNATRTGWTMVSLPYGLEGLRGQEVVEQNENLENGTLLADVRGGSGAFLVDVSVAGLNTTGLSNTASVNFTIVSSGSGEMIQGGVVVGVDATMWINRGGVRGWDNIFYTDKFSTAMVLEDRLDFQVVVDRSIVEVFALEGEKSATLVYYPEEQLDTVVVRSGDLNEGASVSATVYALESTWAAGEDGQVQANGTQTNSTQISRRALGSTKLQGRV